MARMRRSVEETMLRERERREEKVGKREEVGGSGTSELENRRRVRGEGTAMRPSGHRDHFGMEKQVGLPGCNDAEEESTSGEVTNGRDGVSSL